MDKILSTILKSKKNMIITGANGVGKSFLAYELMNKIDFFYYIGVANQSVKFRGVPPEDETYPYGDVAKKRLLFENNNGALEDRHYDSKAYDTYGKYEITGIAGFMGKKFFELLKQKEVGKELKEIVSKFGIDVQNESIKIEDVEFKIRGENDVSSGYQALLRLFTELYMLKIQYVENFTIFLDEISKSLDYKNSLKLLGILEKYFPKYRFLVVTHSYDIILGAQNYEILRVENHEIVDYFEKNYFETIDQVRSIIFEIDDNSQELDEREKILYRFGVLIENIRRDKSENNLKILENYLKEVKSKTKESNKVKMMWEYANKILEENIKCV